MNVIQKYTPNFTVGRKGYKPDVVVVHISAGTFQSCIDWFAMPESQVSSHYLTSKNGEVVQFVKDEDTAWTQGRVDNPTARIVKERAGINPNAYCISIENEGQDLSFAPEAQINALVELIRTITAKWGIPRDRDHIIFHKEIYSKKPNCPTPNSALKDKILNLVNSDDLVNIVVPKSKLAKITDFLLKL